MAYEHFERKEVNKKDKDTEPLLWKILKWYWLLVPIVYFFFVTPPLLEPGGSANADDSIYFVLAFLFLNLGMAGIMFYTPSEEITRAGAAENILKMAVAQQIIAQNPLGAVLALGAWYKLPKQPTIETEEENEDGQRELAPKHLYLIMILILVFTVSLTVLQYLILP